MDQTCCDLSAMMAAEERTAKLIAIDFPEISSQILKKKLGSVEASGANILVTDCPGCVMQLSDRFDKRQSNIEVLHLVELLAKR